MPRQRLEEGRRRLPGFLLVVFPLVWLHPLSAHELIAPRSSSSLFSPEFALTASVVVGGNVPAPDFGFDVVTLEEDAAAKKGDSLLAQAIDVQTSLRNGHSAGATWIATPPLTARADSYSDPLRLASFLTELREGQTGHDLNASFPSEIAVAPEPATWLYGILTLAALLLSAGGSLTLIALPGQASGASPIPIPKSRQR